MPPIGTLLERGRERGTLGVEMALVPSFYVLTALVAVAIGVWGWESSRRKRHPVPAGHRPEIELPHQQEFELYHNAFSLCSMKSRLCLAELGIPYASHPVDLVETGAYENIRPAFLAVNPAGTVPVLVHKGHPVYESHEQIRYAAQHAGAGSPALVPADATLREAMERWVDRSSLTRDPLREGDASAGNAVPGLTLPLFAAMIEGIAVWRIAEGLLFHFDKKRPMMFLTFKALGLRRFGRLQPAVAMLAKSRKQMARHLDAFEAQLRESGGPWILGESFSLADVSWLVIFERLAQADLLHVFVGGGQHPLCAAYWQRLQQRPAYREAITAHAHATVTRGTQRLREAKAADPALRVLLEGA
jgi:glutathione S-transferase